MSIVAYELIDWTVLLVGSRTGVYNAVAPMGIRKLTTDEHLHF